MATTELSATDDASANAAGATADSEAQVVPGADDAPLPRKVAYLPGTKPGGGAFPQAGLAAAAEAATTAEPAAAGEATAAEKAEPAAKEQVLTAAPPPQKAEQVLTAAPPAGAEPAVKKRGFLASLFSANQASAAPAAAKAQKPVIETTPRENPTAAKAEAAEDEAQSKPLVKLASAEPTDQLAISQSVTGSYGSDALPGVRQNALFEITRKSGLDDDSDVDLHEEDDIGPIRVASAAGLARLAPNGLLKQTDRVDTACLKPALVRTLKQMERHFGRKVVITSGYRSASYNRQVRGAKNSQHMYCAAADIQIPGVSKWEVANFARSLPGRGGVGTYCHTESVHVDIGPERDWNWRCRRRKA